MLRGVNSGLYFQTNKVLLFGEVLILKPKKKKRFCPKFLLWYHTKVWNDFVLVLLLCRQFLVVERTVILFSYWMKCLVWMLFIWEDILYMAYFQSTSVFSHTICFKVDTEVSWYKSFTFFDYQTLGKCLHSILFFFFLFFFFSPGMLVPLYRCDFVSFCFHYT